MSFRGCIERDRRFDESNRPGLLMNSCTALPSERSNRHQLPWLTPVSATGLSTIGPMSRLCGPGGMLSGVLFRHGAARMVADTADRTASPIDARGFNFTSRMRLFCADAVERLPELQHIRLAQVAFSFAQTRKRTPHGLYASLTPMRFEGGSLDCPAAHGRLYDPAAF